MRISDVISDVCASDLAVLHRRVQVGQQVALRQSRQQQLLGIPPGRVTTEGRVRRARQGGLARGPQQHLTAVVALVAGVGAAIIAGERLGGKGCGSAGISQWCWYYQNKKKKNNR